jgi:cytochrome c biogenesis protein CcdA
MTTIPFTLTLSLLDSLSTAQQIIIFVLLLTTAKPLRNSMSYLTGLCGAYFLCGAGGFLVLDRLHAFLDAYVPTTASIPNAQYYRMELVVGILMIFIGAWHFRRKRHAPPDRFHHAMVTRFKSMNSLFAFGIGAFISVSSFPVAIPYIIALERYAQLRLSLGAALGNVLLYNAGYALPMIVILFLYLFVRRRAEHTPDQMQERTRVLNVHLTTWAWAGMGIFSLTDALCYFVFGQALVRGRYF